MKSQKERPQAFIWDPKKKKIAILGAQIQAETKQCPDYRVRSRSFYEKVKGIIT